MRRQRGFNLTELLIGLAISLFGLLAVSRVMLTFNQQRNVSVQSIEAQSNGTMALYLIERDLQEAGYGMMRLLNCSLIQWYLGDPSIPTSGPQEPLTTVPVTIFFGGATASDRIRIQYGRNAFGVPATEIQQQQANFTSPYGVATTVGFSTGDLIVANFNDVCTMSQIRSATADPAVNAATRTIQHASVAGAGSQYNPNGFALPTGEDKGWFSDAGRGTPATNLNLAAGPGATLVNLGRFVSKEFSVGDGSMRVAEFPGFAPSPMVDGIVYLKAEYGVDTTGDRVVDRWEPGSYAVSNLNASNVLAIRIGVIARSPQVEKADIDQPATIVVLPAITNGTEKTYTIPTIDSGRRYRYKSYYTIIPLRNVIWG